MRIISLICTVTVGSEFVLHGIAMLTNMEAGIEPLADHLGFRPSHPAIVTTGILDLAAAGGLAAGLWKPTAGIAASGYAVLFFGTLMGLRFRRRLGNAVWPPDFPLFLSLSVINLIASSTR